MNQENIIKRLKEPFAYTEIEWKIQTTTQDKARGLACAYLNARAIQKRLDDVVGPFNWRNEYQMWQANSQVCGISIFNGERNEWLTKYDGAPNSDFEEIKGGLSDAFKRAAVLWGIGRYLYDLGSIWVDIEPRGKSFAIRQDQYARLEAEYSKAVNKLFDTPAAPSAPVNPSQPGQPMAQHTGANSSGTAPFDYQVKSIKPSGKSSQLLELVDNNGKIINAYVKNGDKSITAGARLHRVSMEQKNSSYGPYNLLASYEVAA